VSDTERDVRIAGQLLAVRTVANALISNVDAALETLGAISQPVTLQEPAVCTHPEDKRLDYTPNGTNEARWVCGACGEKGGAW